MAVGIKELSYTVNKDTQQFVNSDLTPNNDTVQFYRGETIQFNFKVVDNNGSPVDFTGNTFLLGIKNPQDMGGVYLADSVDDTGSTPALGLIVMTIDTNTVEMNDFVGFSINNQQMQMELSALEVGVEKLLVFQEDVFNASDVNQGTTGNANLVGATVPILELNPDAKIDDTVVGQTNIKEVPTGTAFIPTQCQLIITTNTGGAIRPTVQFGTQADPDLLVGPVETVATNQFEIETWDVQGAEAISAGEVLEFGVTIASDSVTEEIVATITGYFISI